MIDLISNFLTSYLQYNPTGVLYFTAGGISLAVGLIILLTNFDSPINRSFFLITLTGSIWLFTFALQMLAQKESDAFFWLTLDYVLSVPFISPSSYLFSLHWTQQKPKRGLVAASWVLALFLSIIFLPYRKSIFGLHDFGYGRYDQLLNNNLAKTYFCVLQIFFFVYAALAFANVFREWRTTNSPQRRVQARNFIFAFIIGYTGSLDFYVTLGTHYFPFGFLSFSCFILIVAYTIVRHQFLDINVLLKKLTLISLIYSLLFVLLLPIIVPMYRHFKQSPPHDIFIQLAAIGALSGLLLSLGPVIFAYLTRQTFWLREQSTMGLTHELKSPLGNILIATDTMLSDISRISNDKEKLTDYLQIVQKNAVRLEHFTQDLLNIAKINEGKFVLDKRIFNLSEAIRAEVEYFQPMARAKGLRLHPHIEPGLKFEGDQDKIRQSISNLLSNAIKFTTNGGINVSLTNHSKSITCLVKDDGRGLKGEEKEKIFVRFYHGRHSSSGAGLGLAISKAWIEAHGGKIWAESEGEGKGTKVTFTLPV